MNTTQKAVILSASHEAQDGSIPICPQCGNPLHSGAVIKRNSARTAAEWNTGIPIRIRFCERPTTRSSAKTAVGPSAAMATLTGNSAAGPATMIIGSEETAMMDNFECREIERMYRDGYGPTAISYELGISINTIKSYIRRHPSMKNASRCLYCGKVISQTKGRKVKKFCSDPCRSAYWNYKYRKGGNPDGKGRPQA